MPAAGGLGLEEALTDLRERERQFSRHLDEALEGKESDLKLQGLVKNWLELIDQMRKLATSVLEVRQKQRDLVSRIDFVDSLAVLVAVLKSALSRFCEDVVPAVTGALTKQGVEVGDLAKFQQCLHDEAQRIVDDWQERLSHELPGLINKAAGTK